MKLKENIKEFINYVSNLKGYEKGEAQLFCDRLFRTFGHGGIVEANGALEAKIKFQSGKTKFADCLWSPPGRSGVLIEMKTRTVKDLEAHFPQARDYWIEMNPEVVIGPGAQKPTYIILCNFDSFLIYKHLTFMDQVSITDLEDRLSVFNFLLLEEKPPLFNYNVEDISQSAAKTIGELFKYLIFEKNKNIKDSQRFLLQCVLAMFSEDFDLLPGFFFSEIIKDCKYGSSSYDLIGGLFRQMANPKRATGGRYQKIKYFNGGLFDEVEPIELDDYCIKLLDKASQFNWKHVNPAIFGALFEGTMGATERHAFGAHFTSEADVQKIINPTIVRPWKSKISEAKTLKKLLDLRESLGDFKVLDPACGCGNFLFVAYLALKEIEISIIEKINTLFSMKSLKNLDLGISKVSTRQFFGLDKLPVAVEIAKVTMMLAKEIAAERWNKRVGSLMGTLGLSFDEGLPLDRLDDRIYESDALLDPWPEFDVVIGNPPFQSKNKMQQEMGQTHIAKIREKYPEIPGRADYCVYWFYKAHSLMKKGQRAGLVGTNTIRQNYSREGGLDYIINNGGTITEAVSSQVWSGDAVVYVSIVNWLKGSSKSKKKKLMIQIGDSPDSPFDYFELGYINSALNPDIDVSGAKSIVMNSISKSCYQGQTHGHKGFLLSQDEYDTIGNNENIFPYMTGDDMISKGFPSRYVIDVNDIEDVFELMNHPLYKTIKEKVFPDLESKAKNEQKKTGRDTGPRQNHFKKWWKFWRSRNELIQNLNSINRYIACSRVTKRPIFEFVSSDIRPNDALQVFTLNDDYSFGILQSSIHWEWFKARCSTLKGDWRYTPNTVFDSFPWPQTPKKETIDLISSISKQLRAKRREVMLQYEWNYRNLYKAIDESTENPVSKLHKVLNEAVMEAYNFKKKVPVLKSLIDLNMQLSEKEQKGETVLGPGLPKIIKDYKKYISKDCLTIK